MSETAAKNCIDSGVHNIANILIESIAPTPEQIAVSGIAKLYAEDAATVLEALHNKKFELVCVRCGQRV